MKTNTLRRAGWRIVTACFTFAYLDDCAWSLVLGAVALIVLVLLLLSPPRGGSR